MPSRRSNSRSKLAKGEALPQKRNIIPMPKITSTNVDQFKGEW